MKQNFKCQFKLKIVTNNFGMYSLMWQKPWHGTCTAKVLETINRERKMEAQE